MISILRQRWRQPRRRFPTRPPPGVLLQPPDRRFHQRQLQDAPRPERLQFPGCCLRALAPGRGCPPGALAHPPLDVSPQAVLEDLRLPSRFDGPGRPDILTKPVLSRPAASFTSNPGLGTIIELATVRSINSPQSSLARPTVRPFFWSPPNNNQHWMAAQCGRYVKSFRESTASIFFPFP